MTVGLSLSSVFTSWISLYLMQKFWTCSKHVPKEIRELFCKLVPKIKFMGSLLLIYIASYKSVGKFPTKHNCGLSSGCFCCFTIRCAGTCFLHFVGNFPTLQYSMWNSVGNFLTLQYSMWNSVGNFLTLQYSMWTSVGNFPTLKYRMWSSAGNFLTLQYRMWSSAGNFPTLKYRMWSSAGNFPTLQYRMWGSAGNFPTLQYSMCHTMISVGQG